MIDGSTASSNVPVLFAHANGFPSSVYSKMRASTGSASWNCIEKLGQSPAGVGLYWTGIVQEVLEKSRNLHRTTGESIVGIGHSLGAFSLFLAAQHDPEIFRALILMEPPMLRPGIQRLIRTLRSLRLLNRFPPVSLARKRRRSWPDKDTARDYLRTRALFARFDPDCFEAYIRHGLVQVEGLSGNATRWDLSFPAELEYRIFYNGPPPVPENQFPGQVWLAYGRETDVLTPVDRRFLRNHLKGVQWEERAGGHMFPLEDPVSTGQWIQRLLKELGRQADPGQ